MVKKSPNVDSLIHALNIILCCYHGSGIKLDDRKTFVRGKNKTKKPLFLHSLSFIQWGKKWMNGLIDHLISRLVNIILYL